jgi:hypothetical protein
MLATIHAEYFVVLSLIRNYDFHIVLYLCETWSLIN